ncbi:MAG: ribose 5-phosphate isomerase B [Phycisphaeraceae bacterium]|jgi:ribose 5-phosphate isomerase B|nr:ribose 5-phosphate isomerase B [Phycisphaeraceae bacterium]MDP7347525.1 ribose 5-phosphate isomerase B [Phycisphaeraceae bacterium]
MIIAVACDHGGYPLKAELVQLLESLGHEVRNLGAHELDPADDYPDYARYVGQAIQHGHADRGVIICGSGVGACVAANKMKGVRAGLCHDTYSARQCVEHDDVNVLCLGARIVGVELARELIRAFISTVFSGEERHTRRLEKVNAIEAAGLK